MADSAALVAKLEKATEGLLYQSETDAPVEVVSLAEGCEPEALREAAGVESGEVERVAFEEFFAPLVEEQEWYGEEERETAARFGKVKRLMERSLEELGVFRVGEREVAIFALGRAADGVWVGVRTRAVET